MEDAARAEQLTQRLMAGDSGVLRVGVGMTMLLSGLPDVFRAYRRQYPDVHLDVRDMSTLDQTDALRRGDIDVGFLRTGEKCVDLHLEPVMRDELRIACQQDLARTRNRSLQDLLRHPMVIVSRAVSPTFHDHVLATCQLSGCPPRIVQETNGLLTALMLVQSGVGVSLVPASSRVLGLPRVRILDVSLPGAAWTLAMAWSRRSAAPAAVQHFLRMVREAMPFQPARVV